jgi:glycogen synthase
MTAMRRAAMEQSFSWTRSAQRYKGIYERAFVDAG